MGFIILSTGRAGSGYAAKALTNAGIPTGHEVSYNLSGHNPSKLIGESSWLALPYVEEGVYSDDVHVYHQVRHPLKVIGSLLNGEMQQYEDYLEFQTNYIPMCEQESYLDYSARFVYEWNKRIERITQVRWRVEEFDFNTIQMVAFNESMTLDRKKAVEALLGTSKSTNKHPNTIGVKWSDITNPNVRQNLRRQARRYGY